MNETMEILHHSLRPALIGLGKVISKRSTLPVLGHVRVTRDQSYVPVMILERVTICELPWLA